MSGAYVAKPDVDIPLDIPPGWNPIWSFPGPSPPGYEPEYDGVLSAPAYIVPNSPTADAIISFVLNDWSNYVTNEPTNSSINWSSSVEYAGGAAGSYAIDDDDFWGDGGTLTFEGVSPGDIITVSLTTEPFDDWPIEKTAIITVVSNFLEIATKAVFTVVISERAVGYFSDFPISYGSVTIGPAVISSYGTAWGEHYACWIFTYPLLEPAYIKYVNSKTLVDGFPVVVTGSTIVIITVNELLSGPFSYYDFEIPYQLLADSSATYDCELKLYKDDELLISYTKSFNHSSSVGSPISGIDEWLRLDMNDFTVIEL